MNTLTPVIGTAALLGSVLIGGTFFAFSSFVMKALARVPSSEGIAALLFSLGLMQNGTA